ncbi:MAG: HDOD domain-containing protein [Opitutaceae bacterium]
MSASLTEQELAAGVAELPPVSTVLHRLLEVLEDPDSDLDDITRLIRAETALSAQVLRLANSAHFAMPEPAGSIADAVQRLGAAEVHGLVATLASRQLMLRSLDHYGITAAQLWQHALAVAVSAETVAINAGADRALAYLSGILHPVGMIVLDRIARMRELYPRSGDKPLQEWEGENFDTDNAAVASHVLQQWKFPDNIAFSVAGRYMPEQAEEWIAGARILRVASCMAGSLDAGIESERGLFRVTPEVVSSAGIGFQEYSDIVVEAGQRLLRTQTLLDLA